MIRNLMTITVTIFLGISLLLANVWWRQKALFAEGEAAFRKGEFIVALTGYESAIRMYLPFSSLTDKSAIQIWKLAEVAEQRGDTDRALAAYRSLRSAFYGVRWLRQPGHGWIERCDRKIARLVAVQKRNPQ